MKVSIEISDAAASQVKVAEVDTQTTSFVLNETSNGQNMAGLNVFNAGPCQSAQTASLSTIQAIVSSFDSGSPTHN